MATKRMIPYSVYIPVQYHDRLKAAAKERKASSLVRDALMLILDGGDVYNTAYNKGLDDAAQVVYDNREAQMIAVNRKDLASILADQIDMLRK